MKRFVVVAAVAAVLAVVVAPFALFLWPVENLYRSFSASDRVAADLVAGFPTATAAVDAGEKQVRKEYPELGRPRYSWREVRCTIEDYSAQLSVAEFAQVCTLRSVWLIPVGRSRWDDCGVAVPFVRARSWMFSPKYDSATKCPVVGPESRDGDRSVLIHGRRPTGLGVDQTWEVVEIEEELSSTMIGCRPALPFCTSTFDEPAMAGVAALIRS